MNVYIVSTKKKYFNVQKDKNINNVSKEKRLVPIRYHFYFQDVSTECNLLRKTEH